MLSSVVVNADAREVVDKLRAKGFKFIKEQENPITGKVYQLEKNKVEYQLEKRNNKFELTCCSELGKFPIDLDRVLNKIKPKNFILQEVEMMLDEFPKLSDSQIYEIVYNTICSAPSDYKNWMDADRFDYLYEKLAAYEKKNTQLIIEYEYNKDSYLADNLEENEIFAKKRNCFYDLMKLLSDTYKIKHQGAYVYTMPPSVWQTIKEVVFDTCSSQNGCIITTEIVGSFTWENYFKKEGVV